MVTLRVKRYASLDFFEKDVARSFKIKETLTRAPDMHIRFHKAIKQRLLVDLYHRVYYYDILCIKLSYIS